MDRSPEPSVLAVRQGDGELIPALSMVHKVDGHRLGGRLLVMEGVIAPGMLVHPHTHTREDECTYLLEGELTFLIGGEVLQVAEGSYVPKPRGVRHAFWNHGDRPARVIEMHTPATFDRYYDELGEVFAQHPPGSPSFAAQFDKVAERYGVIMHWDDLPELGERLAAARPAR